MAKRGRPLGHKLSDESKQKISASKMGYTHTKKTKKKIRKGVLKYFKSPEGIARKEIIHLFMTSFWNSEEGQQYREQCGESMKQYYDTHFRNGQGE